MKKNEVPIGAVITDLYGKIISKSFNQKETTKNPLHHAEIIAIQKACNKIKDWRLNNYYLYVNLEPCNMCKQAISAARILYCFFEIERSLKDTHTVTKYLKIKSTKEVNSMPLIKNFFSFLRLRKKRKKKIQTKKDLPKYDILNKNLSYFL